MCASTIFLLLLLRRMVENCGRRCATTHKVRQWRIINRTKKRANNIVTNLPSNIFDDLLLPQRRHYRRPSLTCFVEIEIGRRRGGRVRSSVHVDGVLVHAGALPTVLLDGHVDDDVADVRTINRVSTPFCRVRALVCLCRLLRRVLLVIFTEIPITTALARIEWCALGLAALSILF